MFKSSKGLGVVTGELGAAPGDDIMVDNARHSRPSTPELPILSSLNPISPLSPHFGSRVTRMIPEQEIFVDFVIEEGEPIFYVSSDRPDTILGKVQAKHVTPYTCFLQLIYNLLDNDDIRKAIDNVVEIANIFLPDKKNISGSIFQNYESKIKGLSDARDARKRATQFARASLQLVNEINVVRPQLASELQSHASGQHPEFTSGQVVEESISIIQSNPSFETHIRELMRAHEVRLLCDLVKEMTNTILKELNKDEFTSFLAADDDKDPNEGSKVRNARCGLHSLDQLINLIGRTDERPEAQDLERIYDLTFTERSQFKTGLKTLLGLLPATNDAIKSEGEKFDREIKQFKVKSKERLLIFIREKLSKIDTGLVASHLVIDLFDFKFSSYGSKDDIQNILPAVCARHLAIINKCFPGLSSNKDLKVKLEENFLRLGVLNKSGWDQLEIVTARPKKGLDSNSSNLNFNSLVKKITKLSQTEKYSQMVQCLSLTELASQSDHKVKRRRSGDDQKQLDSQDIANDNPGNVKKSLRPSTSPTIPVGSKNSLMAITK